MASATPVLPMLSLRALRALPDNMLRHYSALSSKAAAAGEWRWNVVPKFHMVWHWSRQCQWVHPKDTATYIDEDFVGHIKGIAIACTSGIAIAKLPWTILAKWIQGMQLRWHRNRCVGADG